MSDAGIQHEDVHGKVDTPPLLPPPPESPEKEPVLSPWDSLLHNLGEQVELVRGEQSGDDSLEPRALLTPAQLEYRRNLRDYDEMSRLRGDLNLRTVLKKNAALSLDTIAEQILLSRKKKPVNDGIDGPPSKKTILERVRQLAKSAQFNALIKTLPPDDSGKAHKLVAELLTNGNTPDDLAAHFGVVKHVLQELGGYEEFEATSAVLRQMGLDVVELFKGQNVKKWSRQAEGTLDALRSLSRYKQEEVREVLEDILKRDPLFLRTNDYRSLLTNVRNMIISPSFRSQALRLLDLRIINNTLISSYNGFSTVDPLSIVTDTTNEQNLLASKSLTPGLKRIEESIFSGLAPRIKKLAKWNIQGISLSYLEKNGQETVQNQLQQIQTFLENEKDASLLFSLYHAYEGHSVEAEYDFRLIYDIARYIQGEPSHLLTRLLSQESLDKARIFLEGLPEVFPEKGMKIWEDTLEKLSSEGIINQDMKDAVQTVQGTTSLSEPAKQLCYSYFTDFFTRNQNINSDQIKYFFTNPPHPLETYFEEVEDGSARFTPVFLADMVGFYKKTKKPIQKAIHRIEHMTENNDPSFDASVRALVQSNWFDDVYPDQALRVLELVLQNHGSEHTLTPNGAFSMAFLYKQSESIDTRPYEFMSMIGHAATEEISDPVERNLTSEFATFIRDIDASIITGESIRLLWKYFQEKKAQQVPHLSVEEVFGQVLIHQEDIIEIFANYVQKNEIDPIDSPALYVFKQLVYEVIPDGAINEKAERYHYAALADYIFQLPNDRLKDGITEDGRISADLVEEYIKSDTAYPLVSGGLDALKNRLVIDPHKSPMISFLCNLADAPAVARMDGNLLRYLVTEQRKWLSAEGEITGRVLRDIARFNEIEFDVFFDLSEKITVEKGKDSVLQNIEALRGRVRDSNLFQYYHEYVIQDEYSQHVDEEGNFTTAFVDYCLQDPSQIELLEQAATYGFVKVPEGTKHAVLLQVITEDERRYSQAFLQNMNRIGLHDEEVTVEQFKSNVESLLDIIDRIVRSPSPELRRIKDALVSSLLATDNPLAEFEKIESIFIRNNLPYIGKLFLTFNSLFPDETFETILNSNTKLSPVLRQLGAEGKKVIFKDLLNIHIETGNRSLEQFLKIFEDTNAIFQAIEERGLDSLTEDEKSKLDIFLDKAGVVTEVVTGTTIPRKLQRQEKFQQIRQNLGVKEGQSLPDRVVELFARPLGYRSVKDVLDRITSSRHEADARSRDLVESGDGKLQLKVGDYVKGAHEQFIANLLQNGIVAKEFLGADFKSSDRTPFDTDTSRIEEIESDFNASLQQTEYRSDGNNTYGNLGIVIREQSDGSHDMKFVPSPSEEILRSDSFKRRILFGSPSYEVIASMDAGTNHYGIRTGVSCTDVAFFIVSDAILTSSERLQEVFFQIAKNGYYIPVTDLQGNIVFTPGQYDEYRTVFRGIELYSDDLYEVIPNSSSHTLDKVEEVKQALMQEREIQRSIISTVRSEVDAIFDELNLLKQSPDTGIAGAAIKDTGSTGRGTNVPGNADFDFVIELDGYAFESRQIVQLIQSKIKQRYPGKINVYKRKDGSIQMHAIQATINGKDVELDFGIIKRPLGVAESTEKILGTIYSSIEATHGPEKLLEIQATISYTKMYLKEHGIYKGEFGKPGGLGGIGVEYWILQNGGSFDEARRTFLEAAIDPSNGEVVDFQSFKRKYWVWDPGYNLLNGVNENLIDKKFDEESYKRMVDVLQRYE